MDDMDIDSPKEQSQKKAVKRDQKKHRLVLQGAIPHGLKVSYISKGEGLLTGRTMGGGIFCDCCENVVSPTMFESHAGRSACRKPYQHIFLSNGMSLHQYASSLKLNFEEQPIACVLCRSCDFIEHGFTERTSVICSQCEKEYHVGCLRNYMNIDLTERPLEDWFCTKDCIDLHSLLKDMVKCGPLIVDDSDAESITNHTNLDLRWFVLSGNYVCDQSRKLLAEAVDILHDCFNPIIDSVSGKDFIPKMAYGLEMGSFNFSGVYTVFIAANWFGELEVVTAGMFRAFGREVAELSLVATSRPYQGQGYLHCFFICLEKLLSHLQVKKLVIPAAADTKAMWIQKFGFRKLTPETLAEYTEVHTARVELQGTTLLERNIRQDL